MEPTEVDRRIAELSAESLARIAAAGEPRRSPGAPTIVHRTRLRAVPAADIPDDLPLLDDRACDVRVVRKDLLPVRRVRGPVLSWERCHRVRDRIGLLGVEDLDV